MAAGIIEVVSRWQYLTNIPEDVAINTFHFELSDTENLTHHASAANRIDNFFTSSTAPMVNALTTYLASYINTATGNDIRTYNIDDPKPRAPRYTRSMTKASPLNTANLPFEVAICGSFKANPISGIPAGRLRNRVYIGPLNLGAVTTTANLPSRPASVLQGDITRSFTRLKAGDTADVVWCGYSRTANIGWEPEVGWVDNEWDTQRRRGQESTSRVVVTL